MLHGLTSPRHFHRLSLIYLAWSDKHKPAHGSKHVSINPGDIKNETSTLPAGNKTAKPKLRMDESAHTFAPSTASASGHYRRGSSPVMITDALSDVRVNYHIEPKELGHGHYGVVRKCMHRDSGEWYAIKSIRKSKVSKIEVLKREIAILKEVQHPHIIELHEVYEDERYLHLITEICTGGELFDRIIAKTQSAEGHFSEHDAAVLVRDILDAIRYCHDEKGIVHRDLKPENFLFLTEAEDAPVKIIDFGLSRHETDMGIMQTKVGTPYYVAPEVLRREYTNSCDIWSIGVITYILLCGYPPFYGESDTQIFESVKVGKFDFPSPEWDEISQSAKDFVLIMLKKSPMDRPTAAAALKHRWLKEQLGRKELATSSISHASVRTGEFTKYLAMKKLRKAALGYIASNLTQTEVGHLAELFKTMDKNDDGHVSLAELDEAIAKGSFNKEIRDDLREMRHELTLSDEETIDYRDFLAATMDRSLAMREENMKMAFEHFKRSDADYLTLEDFADFFGGEAHAKEILSLLDANGDGKVSFDDFRRVIAESMEDDEDETENGEVIG
jgi:calcium-dependent protein kinase